MAKMFYTLEEAAEKLGVDESQVKEMAAEGKLQQFRDRDKLMFKREQVDQVGGGASADSGLPLADSSDTDAINLKDETSTGQTQTGGAKQATGGFDVFESGELEPVDPAAQTQVTQSPGDDDDLALESVGSGSGLLDLTRESDDTSLGAAELLEEISSGAAAGDSGAAVGSSGVFESAIAMSPGDSPSGLEQAAGRPAGSSMAIAYDSEADDPAGSGFGAGMLFGAMVALIIGLIIAIGQVGGVRPGVATMMAQSETTLILWCVGLLAISFVLGGVGWFIGKAMDR